MQDETGIIPLKINLLVRAVQAIIYFDIPFRLWYTENNYGEIYPTVICLKTTQN